MNKSFLNYKIPFLSCCFFFLAVSIQAQEIGSWKDHLSYNNVTQVVETSNKVFAVANGSLFSFSPEDQEIRKYSKINGLSDVDIRFIAYSEDAEALLIVYSNGNLDIFTNSGIYNLPFIKNRLEEKTINGVDVYGRYIYVSTSFCVAKVDMKNKEIPDAYYIAGCYSICEKGDYIYAATRYGLKRGLTTKVLAAEDNWENYYPVIDDMETWNIRKILPFQDALVFWQYNRGLYYLTDNEAKTLQYANFKKVDIVNEQLVAIAESNVCFWTDFEHKTELSKLNIWDISSKDHKSFWIAQGENGLAKITKDLDSNEFSMQKDDIAINSPMNNLAFSLRFQNNKLLVTGGNRWSNRSAFVGTFMVYENGEWFNFDPKQIEEEVRIKYPKIPDYSCMDFISAIEDPKRPGRFYVSSYGEGLYVFEDYKFDKLYNCDNSPLISVSLGDEFAKRHYIRLGGLAFDSFNNLNVTTIIPKSPIQILTNNMDWAEIPYDFDPSLYAPPVGEIIITSKNQKWICYPRYGYLYLIEDNKTPLDFSDDKIVTYLKSFKDQQGDVFAINECHTICEDKKGSLWLGTDKGPVVFYNPQNAIKNPDNFYCTRPIVPYNDGSGNGAYLLESEKINTIAVDGANRKWIGSEYAGVFLVNESGTEVLLNFTAENSPLPSNKVNSIAIDDNTGEIFFATENGLVSYMGDAIDGKKDYSEVKVYPNPVRPEYHDVVTISNLIEGSNVKITDSRGNLVYQGTSKGGMFTWKCVDRNGSRVKTGIYLVFAATPEGTEGVVSKIMVIK